MTLTRKSFSISSDMAPLIDPIAQQSVFRLRQLHSLPSICLLSLLSMITYIQIVKRRMDNCGDVAT